MSTSSFPDSFDYSPHPTEFTHPFHHDDTTFVETSLYNSVDDSVPFTNSLDDVVLESNGVFVDPNAPILPSHDEMQEEGFALRQWRRQNAILLEQKEKREKEILSQIIEEANEFKLAFHEKRKTKCESNITNNREKEKLVIANIEKFHNEADKNYWKSIAELIPNEVPVIKKRGKKENEKKPSVAVIQGPKPGKPTDLARMRQILIKLKHDTPDHLKLAPLSEAALNKGDKSGPTTDAPPKTETVAVTPEAIAAA